MFLMVKLAIRGRICNSIYRYEKCNDKYMEKLPVNTFHWIKDTSQFNKDLENNKK